MENNKPYTTLFNAITDALEALDKLNLGDVGEILVNAQKKTEEMFLEEGEEKGSG